MPVFDSNVFDIGVFDARYMVPLLRNVKVEPESQVTTPGSSVTITIHVMDAETTYGRRFDLNPETSTEIEITRPDGTIEQAFIGMSNLTLGKFFYTHDVGVSDDLGTYSARFKLTNGDKVAISRKMVVFNVKVA